MFTSDYSAQCKKRWPKSLRATLYVTAAQPRFQSFFGGRFFSQNWHFGTTKRITKHNFLVLQSTNLYFISNEDHTFAKKNVSFLLVTSTLTPHLRWINIGKVPRKGYIELGLYRRHRGLDLEGKSWPVKAMDLLMLGLNIPEIGVTLTPHNKRMRVVMPWSDPYYFRTCLKEELFMF